MDCGGQVVARVFTVTTVTKFCFTLPNYDGLYSPPLNSWKLGKWLKTLEKCRFSGLFENGLKFSPPLRHLQRTSRNTFPRNLIAQSDPRT